jgi:WD40 repeat protein
MQKSVVVISLLMLSVVWALAEGTRTWEQSQFDEFEKGTAKGVAIRSDGTLGLAPAFKAVTTTPSTYIWSIAADGRGNVYAAAGAPARVYRIAPDGQTTIIFEPQELQVQSLVVDGKGNLYAATSPDGKVYKLTHELREKKAASAPAPEAEARSKTPIDPEWSSSVYFEPKTKYIWDLALDREGRLYVATGDHGQIFRVEKNGQGSVFFTSDEAHVRVLALDHKENLIAGSDGSGLVYRITPAGQAFVLYSAPKKEITALAIDAADNIYAAGAGEKKGLTPAPAALMPLPNPAPAAPAAPMPQTAPGGGGLPLQLPANFPLPGIGATGSEVYQIAPDGSPKRIWSSRDDLVYALGFDPQGHLLAGTGNKGRIFSINSDGQFTDLLKASATQVTGFTQAPNGGLYVSTSNLGKVFLLAGSAETEGTYQSDVFDAKIFSRWGRAQVRGAGNFDLYARSGNVDNPDRNWSPWTKVDLAKDAPMDVPPARFIQWQAVLHPGTAAPRIDSVLLNYLPKNVAPVIDDVVVQVGARFQQAPKPAAENVTMNVGPGGAAQPRFEAPASAVRDRDSVAVRWNAHDDNDDRLVYSLYYRGDNETRWKLLKDKLADKFYSFDASILPDGGYTIKVVASDAASHSPEDALTDERESARFEVDSTPPHISDLTAVVESGELHITFRAMDTFSVIKRAEYSVDAGDWQFVEPVGRLSDSRTENYDFAVPIPAAPSGTALAQADASQKEAKGGEHGSATPAVSLVRAEHLVVVRVWDRFDNLATAKAVIRPR